jgi:hypothetical protein
MMSVFYSFFFLELSHTSDQKKKAPVQSQESVQKGLFGNKKKCQTHHILRPKEGQKLSSLDNEFLEVARKKKKASKFLLW